MLRVSECLDICSLMFGRIHLTYLPLTCPFILGTEQLGAGMYLCVCVCTWVLWSYTGERVSGWFVRFFGVSQGVRAGKWQMLPHSLYVLA